jgi:phospholipid/cholesterol/gamma-HCH transport system substrate-binding protein
MNNTLRRNALGLLAAAVAASVSACGWQGLNSIPLPGTAGGEDGAYTIRAELPDVQNIQQNSRVRVGDITVGNVTKIERQGWHALITMTINPDVVLPANATATVGQTSLLGSLHVELAPPKDAEPLGRLADGALIPLQSGGTYPSTERALATVSLLLNGGGIGQLQDVTQALSVALAGREDDLRSLITQLDLFVENINAQRDDILDANESLNALAVQFADQKPLVDKAFETVPDALAVLKDQRTRFVDALDTLGRFSALAADSANLTKEALIKELKDVGPVLQSLADAGPALTRSLGLFSTFPFPKDQIANWVRGDYGNLTAVIDLTLSRIDAGFFTGTRFEGKLTELEMQWGRTIGQMPSPYTAGNPLVRPYRWDQGR